MQTPLLSGIILYIQDLCSDHQKKLMRNYWQKIYQGKAPIQGFSRTILTHPFETLFFLPLFLFFSWYVLALNHVFSTYFVLLFLGLIVLIALYFLSKQPGYCSIVKFLLAAILGLFALFAFITHPLELVAEGRDQGTFSRAAIMLAQNGSFSSETAPSQVFYSIYGEGKALHFPGFAYTETGSLIPEFPFGYIVWTAGFYLLFGLTGFMLANGILYVLTGLLFHTLLRRVIPPAPAFFLTLIWSAGFLPLWFLSFTLSENLALFFFILCAESLTRFFVTKERITLLLTLSSAFALALTRIEGWGLLLIVALLLTFQKNKNLWLDKYIFQKPLFPTIFFVLAIYLTLHTFILNSSYYRAIAKALLKNTESGVQAISHLSPLASLYSVLWQYGLFLPFFLALVGAVYLWKKRRFQQLIPFFLGLIALPYLFFPHITLDAPWMLRRFYFALYPGLYLTFFFAAALIINRFGKVRSWLWGAFILLLLYTQLSTLRSYVETSYADTLLPQVENLSMNFTAEDLLLVEKGVIGDNFMMPNAILTHLFNRPAVYFFNPEDYSRINFTSYSRVFLITTEEEKMRFNDIIPPGSNPEFTFIFTNDHSFQNKDFTGDLLPRKKNIVTPVLIFQLR